MESGEGWDVGGGYGFFDELGGVFGQTVQGKGSLVLGPGTISVKAEFDGIADGISSAGKGVVIDV